MIPIADPDLGQTERDNVDTVLAEGRLVAGEEVERFETEFARFCDADHAVGTANGTAALHTALEAAGIGAGDRVVTTPFSFVATANAIRLTGAEPVFADVDPETLNLDPDRVAALAREEDIDAIVVVHLYGLPARMDRLLDIADTHDLTVIEDAAQAHGATIDGRPVGAIGDVGAFSFYPTKNMTTGEGGIVVTDDDDIARRARRYVNHGRTGTYTHASMGHNYRMPNVAGAIGLAQLAKLPFFVERRRENAAKLAEGLADTGVRLPPRRPDTTHAFHQFTVRYERRDALKLALDEQDIQTGVYYPTPIHRQPAYSDYDTSAPVAEQAAREVLSLPVHPGLSETDIQHIVETVAEHTTPPKEVAD